MAKPKDKQPWFKFYPQDWRGDAKLRMCSIGARGLWAEMLCVMHEAEPYGYLTISGKKVVARQMASLAGISRGECMKYLLELASAGVYSEDENKTIYSRRMVRDKAKAEKDRENGKGGGNPKLKWQDNVGVNPPDNGEDKAQKPYSKNHFPEAAAVARELDEMGLKQEGMLKAAFAAECADRTTKPDMSIIKTWLLDGITVATISSTVPPVLRRKVDMKSLAYCDAAVREAHGKAPVRAEPEVDRSGWSVVVEGTLEHTCWNIIRKEQGQSPLFLCTQIGEGGKVYERAAKCPTLFPVEFNDFGERIAPSNEENAA